MRRLTLWLLIFALALLPGCASKYGEQRTTVNYYPACYQPIQDLRSSEHNVAKGTAVGSLIGALGGALTGLLVSGGKWQGAVVGGAVGAAGGAMAGNYYARKQQEQDDNRRLASYLQDLEGDISGLNVVSAAARNSLQCYDRQFRILLGEIKAKRISREAASARYQEIRNGKEEAVAILGETLARAQEMDRQYEQAFLNEEQALSRPQKAAQADTPRKKAAIKAARKKKDSLVAATREIREQKNSAQTGMANDDAEFAKYLKDVSDEQADIRA